MIMEPYTHFKGRSSFRLNIDENYDTPLFVEIEGTADLRVHLFINGYKFGIYSMIPWPPRLITLITSFTPLPFRSANYPC